MFRTLFNPIRRFWTKSIQRQLMLGIALIHAVLMTIFVVDLVERQRTFLHTQALSQATSLAETLAANSTSWVIANDIVGIEEVIASQAKYPGLRYAMLLSKEGELLGHSESKYIGQYVSDTVSRGLLSAEPKTQMLIENRSIIDVAAPVRANGHLIGWARVALSQDETSTGLAMITRDGIVYTLLAIVVGTVFAFFMARGLTLALRHIVDISGYIRRGEGHHRAELGRVDELGQLADNFNLMLDAVDQARDNLAQSEERFDLAMQGSNDGLWDWDLGTDKVYYSPHWKSMLGYTEDEIGEQRDEWLKRLHPDDRLKAQAAIDAHLQNKTPGYENMHRIRHKDGGWRWHLERGVAIRDQQGRAYRMVGTNTDMTARKQAEDRLFEEKERALVTLNSIGDAVITTDNGGIVTFLNPVAEQLTEWPTAEAEGRPLEEVFHIINEESGEVCSNPVSLCLQDGKVVGLANHTVLISRQGRKIAIEDSAAPIRDKHGKVIGVVMVFHDVTQARDMTQQMTWQATHDALTGLINRYEFERRLGDLLKSAKDHGKEHALLYIDLDQFKVVNDTCGHVAGDELLRQLAFILQERVRESDLLARLGGDEFGLLLAGCPMEHARRIAEEVRHTIKEFRFSWQDKSFDVGASIGVVQIDAYAEDTTHVMSAADVACYAAKDLGRNRIHVYEPNDTDLQQRRGEMQWVSRINEALAEDRLALYCQAIQPTLAGHHELHFEVLVRMLDSAGGLVPPAAFIPAAERYNLMPAIDRWVVRKICGCIQQQLCDKSVQPLDTVAINLSGNTLGDEDFLGFVKQQLEEFSVPPAVICFEITETAAIANLARANHFMREMKQIGCRFALDDFGSGLSSFAYLKNLPVDYLKIDGSFIKDMTQDPIDCAMVRSINEVGHVMGIKTIAEFVEDDATFKLLQDIGVDYAQGFGIERPSPILQRFAALPKRAAPSR